MGSLKGGGRRFLITLLCAVAPQSGCCLGPICHPYLPPSPEVCAPAKALPCCCKDHVYIFFVNGLTLIDRANFAALRDHCNQLGFHNTYYGEMCHVGKFKDEIRRIHHADPEAHLVLVGFSFGTNMVRKLAHALKEDGVAIDLLVYLGGDTIFNKPYSWPENVGQVVNLRARGCLGLCAGVFSGEDIDGATNRYFERAGHNGVPMHPETISILTHELSKVASRVPVLVPVLVTEEVEIGPMPRRVFKMVGPRDEWDFLKPNTELQAVGPLPIPLRPSPSPPEAEGEGDRGAAAQSPQP